MDRGDGPVASRSQPRASAGRAGAGVSSMGGEHGHQRPGAGESSRAGGQGRRGRAGQPAPAVLEAALCADDAGGIDPGAGVRQCRQSAAGARRGEKARNRAAAERGRGPASRRAATADRKRSAGVAGRGSGSVVRDLGNSFPYAAAGQRPGELHAARGIELARAGRGGRAFPSDGRAVRPCSGAAVHTRGRRCRR